MQVKETKALSTPKDEVSVKNSIVDTDLNDELEQVAEVEPMSLADKQKSCEARRGSSMSIISQMSSKVGRRLSRRLSEAVTEVDWKEVNKCIQSSF